MRILTLIHEYPPVGGGGGRAAQDIARGLVRRGHDVFVLTAHWNDLPLEEDQEGVHIRRLRSLRRQPFKAGLDAMMGYVAASFTNALDVVRHWHPDLIHVHFAVPAGAVALALSRWSGIPYVLTAHLGDVPGGVPEKTGRWFRWIFPFTPPIWQSARCVAAVSEFTRSLALAKYPVAVQVIPNGVDLDEFDPGQICLNDPPRIIFAGRFMQQKNLPGLVRILAKLKHLPWQCALLGDGPLRPQIEREIASFGMQKRFTLPGWVTPDEVRQWFARSDILFMPSLSEGLPVVGVQGLAMGLGMVLSRAGGNVDLVENGMNGFLLDWHDEEGFVEALHTLLAQPDHLLAFRQASRRMAEKFDIHRVVLAYEKAFQDALVK